MRTFIRIFIMLLVVFTTQAFAGYVPDPFIKNPPNWVNMYTLPDGAIIYMDMNSRGYKNSNGNRGIVFYMSNGPKKYDNNPIFLVTDCKGHMWDALNGGDSVAVTITTGSFFEFTYTFLCNMPISDFPIVIQ